MVWKDLGVKGVELRSSSPGEYMRNLNAVTTAGSWLCLAPILDMVLLGIASQRTVWFLAFCAQESCPLAFGKLVVSS
jgi:hypothetical protein